MIVIRASVIIVLTLAVPLTVVRLLGLDRGFPLVAVMTVFPYTVGLSALATLVALVSRLRPETWVGAVALLVGLAMLAPRVVPGQGTEPDPDGPQLTVAVANLRVGRGDPGHLVAAVDGHHVDVLVVLEQTHEAAERLEAGGLGERLPNATPLPGELYAGAAVHSRLPIRSLPPLPARHAERTPHVELTLGDGGPIRLHAVHPLPPANRSWAEQWQETLSSLPASGPTDGDAPPLILAGDFNATHDHRVFRALLDRGWVDAAAAEGAGLRPTFSAIAYGQPVPPVTLDHVLVDPRVAVEEVAVLPLPRSDHRILIARLRLPRD